MLGIFFFPDGNAAGKRVYGNVKVIERCGYTPIIFCFRREQDGYLKKKLVAGLTVYTIPYSDGIKRLNNLQPYLAFKKILHMCMKEYEITEVIMYTTMGTFDLNRKIISYCKKREIKTIYDFCDYFDIIQKDNILKYVIKKRDLKILREDILAKCDGVITISRYLNSFIDRECPKIIIPPLTIQKCSKYKRNTDTEVVTVSYASYVSDKNRPIDEWKDRIDLMIDVFYELKMNRSVDMFLLKFIGFTKEDLIGMFPTSLKAEYTRKIAALEDNVVFLGQCENSISQKEIEESDYTILLRDSKISTNAGFPTKVSESLSLGVPVITNITSDIGEYVKDSINGVIVPGPTSMNETIRIVESTIHGGRLKANSFRENTVKESPFFYLSYVDRLNDFLLKLKEQ